MTETDIPSSLPDWIADHVKLYLENPDKARLWDSAPVGGPGILPCLLLTTQGRKTGNISMLPLIYGEHEDSFMIVASKGGAVTHPAWYLNLEAEPECEIRVGSALQSQSPHGRGRRTQSIVENDGSNLSTL